MPTTFGPSFVSELVEAGLLGLPFVWYDDGTVTYGPDLDDSKRALLDAVVSAHDPETPAPIPVPRVVSRWQGREAMRITEWGDSDVISAVEAVLADPATPLYYRTAWDELQQFELDSPMLIALAGVIGMTEAQRYDMFRLAESLRA